MLTKAKSFFAMATALMNTSVQQKEISQKLYLKKILVLLKE